MRRVELIRRIETVGCILIRHGANHDLYANPTTGVIQPIPRHTEIKEFLARAIIRKLGGEA